MIFDTDSVFCDLVWLKFETCMVQCLVFARQTFFFNKMIIFVCFVRTCIFHFIKINWVCSALHCTYLKTKAIWICFCLCSCFVFVLYCFHWCATCWLFSQNVRDVEFSVKMCEMLNFQSKCAICWIFSQNVEMLDFQSKCARCWIFNTKLSYNL